MTLHKIKSNIKLKLTYIEETTLQVRLNLTKEDHKRIKKQDFDMELILDYVLYTNDSSIYT